MPFPSPGQLARPPGMGIPLPTALPLRCQLYSFFYRDAIADVHNGLRFYFRCPRIWFFSISLPPSLPSYLSLYFSLSVPQRGPRGLLGTSRLAVLQFWGAACPSLGVQGAQGRRCGCFFGLDGGRPEFAHCLVVIDAYLYQRGQLFFFFFLSPRLLHSSK